MARTLPDNCLAEGSFLQVIDQWPMWAQVPALVIGGLVCLVAIVAFLPLSLLYLFFFAGDR